MTSKRRLIKVFRPILIVLLLSSGHHSNISSFQSPALAGERPAAEQKKRVSLGNEAISSAVTGAEWPSHGRDFTENRYAPISQINEANVDRLGLAWALDLSSTITLSATPLMIGGVLYFTDSYSVIHAVEATSGRLLWTYDPETLKHGGKVLRIPFATNRGLAAWGDRLYVGTQDGRLISVDRRTGAEVWSAQTTNPEKPQFITGAPRAFDGKIIIGNGGADHGAVRGYVSAYDADSGELVWRFYTVPGNPDLGFENPAMEMAAKTWTGEWWKYGGGGTAWNGLTIDPDRRMLYVGTGNGGPWNHRIRSPGGGDNLFLCSIIALDVDSGEYRWHYQINPAETWDYNCTQDMILADMDIKGAQTPVILHTPKNGFFYVINRDTGKVISAEKIGRVTWADHIDLETGRPVETANARYPDGWTLIYPSALGARNWQSMSYDSENGLAFFPYHEVPGYYSDEGIDADKFKVRDFFWNTGLVGYAESPPLPDGVTMYGSLMAWNPKTQEKAWEVKLPGMWNGGVLSTRGNLVFQGNAAGEFAAYRATSGEKLWRFNAGLGIVAAPISYMVDGAQYVTVLVGWGGSWPAVAGEAASVLGWKYGEHPRRVLTFKLDAKAEIPTYPAPDKSEIEPIIETSIELDPAEVKAGRALFNRSCIQCHGANAVAGGSAPDLRASAVAADMDALKAVLHDGILVENGMPLYEDLSKEEISSIYMYIRDRANAEVQRQSVQSGH